jgi:hypothetical protein
MGLGVSGNPYPMQFEGGWHGCVDRSQVEFLSRTTAADHEPVRDT